MMTPLVSLPAMQAPPPAQASVVAGAPTQISHHPLPVNAVPSTGSVQSVHDNARHQSHFPGSIEAASPAIAGASGPDIFSDVGAAPTAQLIRFSSQFVAQVLAQAGTTGEARALASYFVHAGTAGQTLNAGLMEVFSMVKYKPSFAALPHPDAPPPEPEAVEAPPAPRPGTSLFVKAASDGVPAPVSVAAASPPIPREGARSAGVPSSAPRVSYFNPARSLVKPTGVEAYVAAFSRNYANIGNVDTSLALVM